MRPHADISPDVNLQETGSAGDVQQAKALERRALLASPLDDLTDFISSGAKGFQSGAISPKGVYPGLVQDIGNITQDISVIIGTIVTAKPSGRVQARRMFSVPFRHSRINACSLLTFFCLKRGSREAHWRFFQLPRLSYL